ncbi:hypothetical protein [Streptacidiphilus sp. P02-A3a]|uniref:hypothetical protein n=1 Tax=Streptacidiphilus sp. P02-A3a TaxID=2704468 RepID=UPI0015FBBB9C|nr:hypothetical protein [Streptacidiphilus sp. P02-A3a]QMU70263.1 hypothetical protein GXP74_20620 [Streptacidiphilus sp. P02-A3a]QMU70279.1 hypothetical protein GXP74_20750 [Streptacidiphilus sp. P02-A3a]
MSVNTSDDPPQELTLAQLTRHKQSGPLPLPIQNPGLLPFNDLDPEVFERVVAEVVSRRHNLGVQFYGRRGQKQYGLDIVEREPSQQRSLYQVKRYQQITDKQLRDAVETYAGPVRSPDFQGDPRRFDPYRLVVATSAQTDSDTAIVDALATLQNEYAGDLVIEAWGAEALSRALRDAPHLVFAVFGPHWASAFCGFTPSPAAQSAPTALGLVDDPAEVLGLDALQADAAANEERDPLEAAHLLGLVAEGLRAGGFPVHSATMYRRQARVLVAGGDLPGAFSRLVALTLAAISSADHTAAVFARKDLEETAGRLGGSAQATATVLSAVDGWSGHGSQLAVTVPALETLAAADDEHAALLCCLVIEQAIVDGLYDRVPARSVLSSPDADTDGLLARLRSLAAVADLRDPVIRARLRCAAADAAVSVEGTRDELDRAWQQLVRDAAAGRFHGARALVASRAAYAFAVRGDGEQAENLWRQAVLASSEEQLYGDARGALRSLQHLALDQGRLPGGPNGATGGLPDRKRLLASAVDPALSALEAAHHGRLPDALGDVRRYLWEARLSGDRCEEAGVQALLGDVLSAGGHHFAAAHYYLEAGVAERAAAAARAMTLPLDVTDWLNSPVRYRQAAAIEVLKAQAASLPDTMVPEAVQRLLALATTVWAAPRADPAPERQALNAVAAFGRRIPDSAVDTILDLAQPATVTAPHAPWPVVTSVIAKLLVQTYWAVEPRRHEIAEVLGTLLGLPQPPHGLWPLILAMPGQAREPLLAMVCSRAEAGDRNALQVLARWREATPAVQTAARQACAALLRRPVDVPRHVMTVDTQATDTVDHLNALLEATVLVDVCPDDLSADRTQPAGGVVLQMQLNPAPGSTGIQDTEQSAPHDNPDQASGPDRAALLAAGPLVGLTEAVARHLLAMAEDTHDTAPSRIQAIDALRALLFRLPEPVLRAITDRMLIVSRDPGRAEIDQLMMEATGAFSRATMNLGITHLPGMALVLATDAFIHQRDQKSPLAAQETAFADEVVASSAALMRHPDAELRKLGAVALHDLAYGAPDAAVHVTGMLFHTDPQVRVLGADVVPLTPGLKALLASDPAPEVRQALSDRLATQSPTTGN